MSCNKYKNCHYKSAVQMYNNVTQTIAATNVVTNPLVLSLGNLITDTGISIDGQTSGIDVDKSGLYRFYSNVEITPTVAGSISVALTINGVTIPETARTVTTVAGAIVNISTETIRQLQTCCNISDYVVGVVVYSDGTATGTVNTVSTNAVKLA